MIDTKFNRWTLISDPFKMEGKKPLYVVVRCECGSEKTLTKSAVTSGQSKSCGCLQKEVASVPRTYVEVGTRLNKLTILEDLGMVGGKRRVVVACDCGSAQFTTRLDAFISGHTKSCGCLQVESVVLHSTKHGMSGTPTYSSWQSMKERCRNPNTPGYENYGGRGITYDPRWEDFVAFYEDMGDRPNGLELDRIDVDGNYYKENCQWADATTQSFNRRKMQGTSSEYVGVSYDKERNCWQARLNKHDVVVFRGRFATQEAAAQAYDAACQEHYGVTRNFSDKEINNVSS